MTKQTASLGFCLFVAASTLSAQEILWQVGTDDNGWPIGGGGGPLASFVQENGTVNPLPGVPDNLPIDQQADNDYYLAGTYTEVIPGNGDYFPLFTTVTVDEEAAERALTAANNVLRYHFNLPETLQGSDRLSVSFDAFNLDTRGADPRYGVEVYVNGVLVQPQILIRQPAITANTDYTTPQFTLDEVGAVVGPGYDNIVTLRGIQYPENGGGDWLGIDYVQMNHETEIVPPAVFPVQVGMDDDGWPAGDGGAENASFVQENAEVNDLPGSPTSPETDQQADNDYYMAGLYETVIAANGDYTPVGLVEANEEAAERALTPGKSELCYHFNLPNTLAPTDRLQVTFDAFNLDTGAANANPRFGVEVYVNGTLVQEEIVITPDMLGTEIITPGFTLSSVGAQVGAGFDNILTLRGISYADDGGGNWMGIDYVKLDEEPAPIPAPLRAWTVGLNDDAQHTDRSGGAANANFVQENGTVNPLPGVPNSPSTHQQADNDYYLAGLYTMTVEGNGDYEPVGRVPFHEEAAERAFAGADTELRYHFNFPADLTPDAEFSVSFDAVSIDTSGFDPRWGVEVYVNNVLVMPETVVTQFDLGRVYHTEAFTLDEVNAEVGPGYDNIITLKGISYNGEELGGGNWLGIDFVQLNPVVPNPFPWTVGMDDNNQPIAQTGGGPNTSFVQENGSVNLLPGSPDSREWHTQSDNDYYFAGLYTNIISSVEELYGWYEPVGEVLVNEDSAERAFTSGKHELRYHFNLPESMEATDELIVSFDAFSFHEDVNTVFDPRRGIEVLVNGVLVMPEVVLRPEDIDRDIFTEPFTLASVNAEAGPGHDNIITLRGIQYEDGGNWMGIDYVRLDTRPTPIFPWTVGRDDNDWPIGDGGEANASFVQENGDSFLPGSATSPEVAQQADNDYYLAGEYNTALDSVMSLYGVYEPIGLVPRHEEAAERAITVGNLDLRYHFNLPATMQPTDVMAVSFDIYNLDEREDIAFDPHWGIEVLINGVLVQEEITIRPENIDTDYTTPLVTLAEVNAVVGPGADNIVTLRGIPYSGEGGGDWMGIDYVSLHGEVDEPLEFLDIQSNGEEVTITWTGEGTLEWAPEADGPWNPVEPAPSSPYTEDIVANADRFYRLTRE